MKCDGSEYCDCAGKAMKSGANRYVVDGYEEECPFRKVEVKQTPMPDPELWSFVCDQIDIFHKLKGNKKEVDRHVGLFINLDSIVKYKSK